MTEARQKRNGHLQGMSRSTGRPFPSFKEANIAISLIMPANSGINKEQRERPKRKNNMRITQERETQFNKRMQGYPANYPGHVFYRLSTLTPRQEGVVS